MNYQLFVCSLLLIFCTMASAYWNVYGPRAARSRPYYPGGVRYYYDDVDDDYYNRYYPNFG